MVTEYKEFEVEKLIKGFNSRNRGEELTGMDGKLIIQPAIQRLFQYDIKKQAKVVDSIMSGQGIHMLSFNKDGNRYEVIDGLQRITSLGMYAENHYQWNHKYYNELTVDEKKRFLKFKIPIQIRELNTCDEKGAWFTVLNIEGLKMTDQEKRNATATSLWLKGVQRYFSREEGEKGTIADREAYKKLIKVKIQDQGLLEVALRWHTLYLAKHEPKRKIKSIGTYMDVYKKAGNPEDLILHFQNVLTWVNTYIKPEQSNIDSSVNWGHLHAEYSKNPPENWEEVRKRFKECFDDLEIKAKRHNIYEYVLGGESDIKLLQMRKFSQEDIRRRYQEVKGVCEHKKYNNCKFDGKPWHKFHADHKKPWSKGGKTEYSNLQLLCPSCNSSKSDKY